MRVLVTGGAGLIGSHVVETYVAEGHDVFVVDDLSHGRRANLPVEVPLFELDVRSPEMATLFDEVQPEVLNHHAAQVSVPASVQDPAQDASVNVLGTVNLLQQAVRHQVRKVIFASCVAVYGDPEYVPCDEEHPTCPLSPYGASKLTGEAYLQLFSRLHGLEATIFRYGNVYGPRQDAEGEAGVVAVFVQAMLGGAAAVVDGDGLQTRDFVYVEDVARANLLALEAGDGDVLNLGTGIAATIQGLWEYARDLTGYQRRETHGPPRDGDIRHMVLSTERAAKVLGWRAQVSLEDGLRKTIAAFRKAG